MRPVLLLALLLSTSSFACDKSGSPPPGPGAGSSAGPAETPPGDAPVVKAPPEPAAPATVACGDKTCGAGEECISYYGIAGPRGPQFHECGIPCKQGAANDGCADGKRCQTIADGPGPVCR